MRETGKQNANRAKIKGILGSRASLSQVIIKLLFQTDHFAVAQKTSIARSCSSTVGIVEQGECYDPRVLIIGGFGTRGIYLPTPAQPKA